MDFGQKLDPGIPGILNFELTTYSRFLLKLNFFFEIHFQTDFGVTP